MKIELLVGMICSGKSNYTRERAKDGALTVNDDSIVMALHGNVYSAYSEELKPLYKTLEYNIVATGVLVDRDIIIDRPCHSPDTRQRYIQIAKSLDTEIEAVIFPREDYTVHAERRFKSDSRGLDLGRWQRIAYDHACAFEEVHLNEGFTRIINVTDKDKRYYPFSESRDGMDL